MGTLPSASNLRILLGDQIDKHDLIVVGMVSLNREHKNARDRYSHLSFARGRRDGFTCSAMFCRARS